MTARTPPRRDDHALWRLAGVAAVLVVVGLALTSLGLVLLEIPGVGP